MMLRFEIKKVCAKTGSRVALLLLLALVLLCSFFAADVTYIDENGDRQSGPAAAKELRAARAKWAGPIDEKKIRLAIAENRKIRETPQARSTDTRENDIAYSWGQGVQNIRDLLNCSFAKSFRDYDYYRADSLSEADAPCFYENRIRLLREWLETEASDQFSDSEKQYLLASYAALETPFDYAYMDGFTRLFEYSPTVIMITMLVLSYLVAGIFSNEFSWKSDAIFFSSLHGRGKAVRAKAAAGLCIVTAVYWAVILLYSAIVLLCLGAGGSQCPVQAYWGSWKCFYPITIGQKYVLVVLGGYVGCLFLSCMCMLVSAKTKSAVLSVLVPFVLVFVPSFLGNINSPLVAKIIGLLPDQLLQVSVSLDYFNVYTVAGRVFGAIPLLFALYGALFVALPPLICRTYRRTGI